ncbi:LamG-like jellyroll fold domain-containing protein, partial [Microbulbifer sp. SA54]|uniref:LamG-like jellyroll fold domain-containing protein n=1 Tax=Microbulbifer sp. SA54 TaxID=3401577 RepID=UPI003AB00A91
MKGISSAVACIFCVFFASFSSSQIYKEKVLEDSPIAYWDMEVAGNGEIPDLTGNGWNLEVVGPSLSYVETGLNIGRAVSLNGVSQALRSKSIEFPELQNAFTFEVWAKIENASGWRSIAGRNSVVAGHGVFFLQKAAVDQVHVIGHKTNGHVAFGFEYENGRASVEDSTPASLNQWKHYVVTYDGRELVFYRNGIRRHAEIFEGQFFSSDGPLIIGGASLTGSIIDFFDGDLSNFAFYDRSLSPSEVHDHYLLGAQPSTLEEVLVGSDLLVGSDDFGLDNKSIVVDGATLTLDGSHEFYSVVVRNGGQITHSVNAKTASGADGLEIVTNYLEIDATSSINVDSKGSLPTDEVGADSSGSYGGRAGISEGKTTNATYGDYKAPQHFGTGGRYNSSPNDSSNNTRGGGSIKLSVAGELRLDGVITANGGADSADDAGSGGSIWLDVGTLTVSESPERIRANGARGYDGSGGGRIAIYYDNANLNPAVHTSTAGGPYYSSTSRNGQPGTVYVEDRQHGWSLLRFDNKGINKSYSDPMLISGEYTESRVEFVNVNVAISDASFNDLYFSSDIAALANVTAVSINQSSTTATLDGVVAGTMRITGGSATAQGLVTVSDSFSTDGTNLLGGINSNGNWKVPGANGQLLVDGYTYTMDGDESWDQVFVRNGGVITHSIGALTASGADGVELIANYLEIDATSSINLDSKGSLPTDEVGADSSGSYGGLAGTAGGRTTNATYGDYKTPHHFGTGGRYNNSSNDSSNNTRGGGSIKLSVAGELRLDGVITANGGADSADGAGSGGSIWLDVGTLTVSESPERIRANGAQGYDGSGGGRIAIYYDSANLDPAVHASATGGPYYSSTSRNGQPGTVYVEDKQSGRTLLRFENKGRNKSYSDPMLISGEYTESRVEFVNVNVAISDASFNDLYFSSDIAALTNVTAVSIVQSDSTATLDGVVAGTMRITGGSATAQGLVTVSDSFSTDGTNLLGGINSNGNWKIPGANDQLVVDGYTYTMDGDESWDQVFVRNGGVITHSIGAQTASGADGVELTANYLEIDNSSAINLDSKGNLPTDDLGADSSGSYGGLAGTAGGRTTNATYGDYKTPHHFGTGGRYNNSPNDSSNNTRGGGAIKLSVAGELRLDGVITANGGADSADGAGSGGSIWLDVGTFTVSESPERIRANGAQGYDGSGGGRIAIYYDSANLDPAVHASATGGPYYSSPSRNGQPGTVYVEDKQSGRTLLRFENKGRNKSYSDPMLISGEYTESLVEFVNVNVAISDASFNDLYFSSDIVALTNVTAVSIVQSDSTATLGEVVTGAMSITGGSATAQGLVTVSDSFSTDGTNLRGGINSNGNWKIPGENDQLVVDGYTYTMDGDESWDQVFVRNGGVITHSIGAQTASGADGVELTANYLEIDNSSAINLDSKGNLPTDDLGTDSSGSYGGLAGTAGDRTTNATYGDYKTPQHFGTGGRYNNSPNDSSNNTRGGGAIKLSISGELRLDGIISANGGSDTYDGAGSGGSIWLDVGTLSVSRSSTQIRASGAQGYDGSGGGRIALYYDSSNLDPAVHTSAMGGAYYTSTSRNGQPGTIYVEDKQSGWSLLRFDNKGINKSYSDPMLISGEYTESLVEFVNVNVAISDASFNDLYFSSDVVALTNVTAVSIVQSNSTATLDGVVTGTMNIVGGSATAQGLVTVSDSFSTDGTNLRGGINSNGNWKVPGANDQLLVDGYTYTMEGDESWDQVFVRNGGVITHSIGAQTASGADGVELTANYLEIDTSSAINLDSKGNLPTDDLGADSSGSYGGLAGTAGSRTTNATYGDYKAPQHFGTGGRYNNSANDSSNNTRGGGAIKLNISGELRLDGIISANGGSDTYDGAGSGGSIWLDVGILSVSRSSTQIRANGAQGYDGSGGGRIALYYDSANLDPAVHTSATGGSYYTGTSRNGQPGTVYVEDRQSGRTLLRLSNKGKNKSYSDPLLFSGDYLEDEVVFGDLIVELSDSSFNKVRLENSIVNVTGVVQVASHIEGHASVLRPFGQLLLPGDGGELVVDGFSYELSRDETWGKVSVINGGSISHVSDLSLLPAMKGVALEAREIYVEEGSAIDVSYRGQGPNGDVGGLSGGSYGGLGGTNGSTTNPTFGSELQPDDFGIGGKTNDNLYSRGGGAIRLIAEDLILNGSLLAHGQQNSNGGGAGGSIWVESGLLRVGAKALIAANGAHGSNGGGGGGGRIALYYDILEGLDEAQIQVNGGRAHNSLNYGQGGTIYMAERGAAPKVKSLSISGYSNQVFSEIAVQFSVGINPESIDSSDFELINSSGSPVQVTSVASGGYAEYLVTFGEPVLEGTYTFSVGPDIFGTNGLGMDQDQDG